MDLEKKIMLENQRIEHTFYLSPKKSFEATLAEIELYYHKIAGRLTQDVVKSFRSFFEKQHYTVEFNNFRSLYLKARDRSLRHLMLQLEAENHVLDPAVYEERRSYQFDRNPQGQNVYAGQLVHASNYRPFPTLKKTSSDLQRYISSSVSLGYTFEELCFDDTFYGLENKSYEKQKRCLPLVTFRLLYQLNGHTVNRVFSTVLRHTAFAYHVDEDLNKLIVEIRTQKEATLFLDILKKNEVYFVEHEIVFHDSPNGKPHPRQILTPQDGINFDTIETNPRYTNLHDLLTVIL